MFKVTLVYTDKNVYHASSIILFNDLDLVIHIGNDIFYPNSLHKEDHKNNVEVILIPKNFYPSNERKKVKIQVKGFSVNEKQVYNYYK